jgi:hypothetical protein
VCVFRGHGSCLSWVISSAEMNFNLNFPRL